MSQAPLRILWRLGVMSDYVASGSKSDRHPSIVMEGEGVESDCKCVGTVVHGARKGERSKTMAKWVGWEVGLDTPKLS